MRTSDADSTPRPEVNPEFFPMKCVQMSTLLGMDRFLSFQELTQMRLLVTPTRWSRIHFVSHEWLSFDHPDPSGVQLRRLQQVFRGIIAGRGSQYFSERDWETFAQGHSSSWTPRFAHLEDAAQHDKISDESFKQDVELGLVWIDFLSVPQVSCAAPDDVDQVARDQRLAVRSIPHYLERSSFFWVLVPKAKHEHLHYDCCFASWRRRGWCRLEEWANFLSLRSLMPLVVSDESRLVTYSMVSFILDNVGKPERAPCMGAFTCCKHAHVREVGSIPVRMACDKEGVVQVLNRMYQAKIRDLLQSVPNIAYMLLGLEPSIYSGAEAFHATLLPSIVARVKDADTPESFASVVGFQDTNGRDAARQDLLQVAVWCHHNAMVHKLLQLRAPRKPWHRNVLDGSAFDLSCACGNVEVARALSAREDFEEERLNVPNVLGATSLHLSAENGHVEIVQLLLQRRAQVDLPKPAHSSAAGQTALHCAAAKCHAVVCAELLRRMALVGAQDARGATPLSLVLLEGSLVTGNQAPSARADTLCCLKEAAKKGQGSRLATRSSLITL